MFIFVVLMLVPPSYRGEDNWVDTARVDGLLDSLGRVDDPLVNLTWIWNNCKMF